MAWPLMPQARRRQQVGAHIDLLTFSRDPVDRISEA